MNWLTRENAQHSRKSFWLRFGWARALRLRALRRILRQTHHNNALGMKAWNDLWAMKMHMTDKGSCHPTGRWNDACRIRLPRTS